MGIRRKRARLLDSGQVRCCSWPTLSTCGRTSARWARFEPADRPPRFPVRRRFRGIVGGIEAWVPFALTVLVIHVRAWLSVAGNTFVPHITFSHQCIRFAGADPTSRCNTRKGEAARAGLGSTFYRQGIAPGSGFPFTLDGFCLLPTLWFVGDRTPPCSNDLVVHSIVKNPPALRSPG